jgi:hypothetical protein
MDYLLEDVARHQNLLASFHRPWRLLTSRLLVYHHWLLLATLPLAPVGRISSASAADGRSPSNPPRVVQPAMVLTLLSSTSKSQSLSHMRNPHAVCDNNLVFIKEGSELLGWFEFLGRIGKKVGREPDFRSARQLRVSLVSSAQ